MAKLVVVCAALALSIAVKAQMPGQYPPGQYPGGYPPPDPGTYPPGTYPGPSPAPHETGIPRKGKKKKQDQLAEPTLSFEGKTISNDGKKLVIATEDGRLITMTLTADTKYVRGGADLPAAKIIPRTTVKTDAAEDDESYLTATQVELTKDAPAGGEGWQGRAINPAAAANDEDAPRPTILENPVDAPGRPLLRHAKPSGTQASDDSGDGMNAGSAGSGGAHGGDRASAAAAKDSGDFTIDTDSDQPKIAKSGDDLVDRTREWAMTFTNGLPNFVCEQDTTRYQAESHGSGFQAIDVVTAKVVYEDGHEDYREITVGGKRTNKKMLELGGSTSTGEFATTLRSLFSGQTDAQFKFYQSASIGDTKTRIYDFKVALRNSDWFTLVGGQALRPAYSGSVWIDRATGEVRRIEMQADNVPKNFPLVSEEWAVDYDEVSLGTAKFLLPVHAETLGCWRRAPICDKNATDFRDYHKFSGESSITFGK